MPDGNAGKPVSSSACETSFRNLGSAVASPPMMQPRLRVPARTAARPVRSHDTLWRSNLNPQVASRS